MTRGGERQLEAIQQDLACPQCEYNLRGLSGAIVTCPECGTRCDAAEAISRKWTGPWFRAPGFLGLSSPVAVLFVYGLMTFVCLFNYHSLSDLFREWWWQVLTGLGVVTWIALLVTAVRRFGSLNGIWLSLLGHILFATYVVGLFVAISVLGMMVVLIGEIDAASVGRGALALLGALVLVILARLGERFMARRCIRQYLSRPPRIVRRDPPDEDRKEA